MAACVRATTTSQFRLAERDSPLKQQLSFPLLKMRKFFESFPMVAVLWVWLTAGMIVEFNRYYPDLLFHPMSF